MLMLLAVPVNPDLPRGLRGLRCDGDSAAPFNAAYLPFYGNQAAGMYEVEGHCEPWI
jgi:hypothetical protein